MASAPQTVIRRIRRNIAPRLLDTAHSVVFRMLHAPRSRVWKYPGLMHRPATPDIQAALLQTADTRTFIVSRRWSRCCLILFVMHDHPTGVLLLKENHRLEVVNLPGHIPHEAFRGTIIDGFLEVDGGQAVFHVVDVIRWGGRWLGATGGDIDTRRGLTAELLASPSDTALGVRLLPYFEGVSLTAEPDKASLVYVRTPRGTYRAHMLVLWYPPPPPAVTETGGGGTEVLEEPAGMDEDPRGE